MATLIIQPNQIITGHIFLYCIGVDEDGSGYQWEPTKLDWQDIRWCEERNDEFNKAHAPLKLTTDLILMNGFIKDDNGHLWKDLMTHYIEFIPGADGWYPVWAQMPEMSSEAEQRTSLNRIIWFHEFQTLLFTLTGAWPEKVKVSNANEPIENKTKACINPLVSGSLPDSEIFLWLQKQKYQTERGEQEYKMYFDVDMPKIIKAAIAHFSSGNDR